MGLSIHYSSNFRESASLIEMINEVKDIVDVCQWKYNIYNKEFPNHLNQQDSYNENIYGISFTPPGCETVSICFLSNGKMSSPVNLKFYGKTGDRPEQKYLYMLSVKTQFAGIETHKFIIELFRYLEKQEYLENLEIMDEGEYWETGDENRLQVIFNQNVTLLDNFSSAIEIIPKNNGESYENYFERLMNIIRNRNHDKG